MFRDVRTDCGLSSAEFDSSVKLIGSTPLSSATQQSGSVDSSQLLRDIITHLPSVRDTYLEIAPVSRSQSQYFSRFLVNIFDFVFWSCLKLLSSPVCQFEYGHR